MSASDESAGDESAEVGWVAGLVREALQSGRSDGTRVEESVAAIVTVGEDRSCLGRTVHALAVQDRLPGQVVVAVCAPAGASSLRGRGGKAPRLRRFEVLSPSAAGMERPVKVVVLPVGRCSSFGEALNRVLRANVVAPAARMLWLLHDDSAPVGPQVLSGLLSTYTRSPRTVLVGAKQVDWKDGTLQSVGYKVDSLGRRASLVVDGEEDQRQYDSRRDVFGVSLAGALVSRSAFRGIGGANPWYGTFGESFDVSRRLWRAGGRVVVEPRVRVAHRRSRYAGLREADDRPSGRPRDSYARQVVAREKLSATQTHEVWALPAFLGSLLVALLSVIRELFAKEPYRAWCELWAPWVRALQCGRIVVERVRLRRAGSGGNRFLALRATHAEMREWRTRRRLFQRERRVELVNPLGRDHLRRLSVLRARWVGVLALVGLVLSAAANWTLLPGLFSGRSLSSASLMPTGAGWKDVWQGATLMWTTARGLGSVAAPMPFNLVLLVFCALGFGSLPAGITVFWLLALPLSMLSMFALAGTVTRSNPLRFSAALVWGALAASCGLLQSGNLPMMVVWVLLPVSFYLVFRAVGRYSVDEPHVPYASIQSAALAGLTMAFVALSEPQTVLPFFLVFLMYFVLVRGHRPMLLLMPLPSIVLLAPTFFSMLVHWREGLWRQLFSDVLLPSAPSSPGAAGTDLVCSSGEALVSGLSSDPFRVGHAVASDGFGLWQTVLLWICCGVLVVLLVAAVCGLFVSRGLRASRLAWAIVLAGLLLSALSIRVAVAAVAGSGTSGRPSPAIVHGSVLPGLSFSAMGLLLAGCALTGRRDSVFFGVRRTMGRRTLRRERQALALQRSLAGLLALQALLVGVLSGFAWPSVSTLSADPVELPIIAGNDLAAVRGGTPRRILALSPRSDSSLGFTVLSTPTGDLLDRNATVDAENLVSTDPVDRQIGEDAARFLSGPSSSAALDLARRGFAGIFVPFVVRGSRGSRTTLVSNIQSSEGTTKVVDNASGLYVRLPRVAVSAGTGGAEASDGTVQGPDDGSLDDLDAAGGAAANTQGVDETGLRQARTDPQRVVWLALCAVVLFATLVLAIPRSRHLMRESGSGDDSDAKDDGEAEDVR